MQKNVRRFLDRYAISDQTPDLRLLTDLTRAYSNLPYENVTKILKAAGDSASQNKFRQTEEVLEDHLRWNTGGTCFSLCNALQEILHSCGFEAFIAMADMHYGANINCAIVVTTAAVRYLIDPGYLLHHPIPLPQVQGWQQTPMNIVVLKNEGGQKYSLFTEENGVQRWRYRLRAEPVPRAEFETHWLRSFSLNSMEHVMLTRVNESGRIYYRKDRLELVTPNRRTSQTVSGTDSALLANTFGVPSDLIAQAQKVLGR